MEDAQNQGSLGEIDEELQESQLQKAVQMSMENFRGQCRADSSEASSSKVNDVLGSTKECKKSSSQIPLSEEIRRKREKFLERFEK